MLGLIDAAACPLHSTTAFATVSEVLDTGGVDANQPLPHVANDPVRQRHDRGDALAQVAPERLGAGHVPDVRCLQVFRPSV